MTHIRWTVLLLLLGFLGIFAISAPLQLAAEDSEGQAISTFVAANLVIGQPDFTSNQCDQGGAVSASDFCSSEGTLIMAGKKLYAVDSDNDRVLGFKTFPKTNGASAKFVLGQSNFTSNGGGTSSKLFGFPVGAATDGKRLVIADFDNSRVLIWNKLPTKTDTPASVVVGQPNFTSSSPATTQSGMDRPEVGVALANGKLFVSDRNNNRILIWNKIPTSSGANADVVVGQSNFTSSISATSQTGLSEPEGLWTDGTRLVVADFFNSRVLIWNSIPTTNGAAADVVVGQPDFMSFDNPAPPTAQSLNEPGAVTSDGTRLFVADSRNNRVLVYNTFPTSNQPTADIVLGQADFTHSGDNAGGATSAQSLSFPDGLFLAKGHLFVNDFGNSRFLVFNNP
jgi:hypothetical protein